MIPLWHLTVTVLLAIFFVGLGVVIARDIRKENDD